VALRVYQNNKKFYDPILKRRDLAKALGAVKASVLLISGCQDNQLSQDGTFNGLFTDLEDGLEWRNVCRIVPAFSHRDRKEDAAGPDAEAVDGGHGQRGVLRAEAVHDRCGEEGSRKVVSRMIAPAFGSGSIFSTGTLQSPLCDRGQFA
jgi:hypothetical protein